MQDTIEASYRRQAESGHEAKLPSRFSAPASVDNWRHTRMLSCARPLVDAMPGSRWLTIGDGNYGSDAAYLNALGAKAVASSLVTDSLRLAAEKDYISEFREENAERISLENDSVDFVLCKEAYHHFPRPPIALYEMLRVARVGVLLIEPVDGQRMLDGLKQVVKKLVRGDAETRFEPSGNFIYRLDIRETAKLMTAMGESHIASKRFNDFYMPGLGGDRAEGWTRGHVLTRFGIGVQNILSGLGLLAWGLAGLVILKGKPADEVIAALRRGGFRIEALPVNPYALDCGEPSEKHGSKSMPAHVKTSG
jgi:ubiquinone/menaquinone biosynthesis C-methylase UbiE